ncbi:MAG: hypothetical protein M1387_08070 [Thaumarchaeota archaeon]|nr:hypothetical protein [Nitrososphaerota archaeon]
MGVYFIGGKLPPGMGLTVPLFGQAQLRELTSEEKSLNELIQQLSTFTNSDKWWFWRRIGGKEALKNFRLNLDQKHVEIFLDAFKKVFDNNWWNANCKSLKGSVAPDPLSVFGGQVPILSILRLGECIHSLGGPAYLPRDMIKRLRNRKSFKSVATELEIASCFVQSGFALEMYPNMSSGTRPEGKLSEEGNNIYYEVTEQHWSGYDLERFRYQSRIIDLLSDKIGPVNGSITLRSGQERLSEKVTDLLEILSSHFILKGSDSLPFKFTNDDFDTVLWKADPNGGWVGINGFELSSETVVKNWVNHLFKKTKQLPKGESSVVIGSPLFLWGQDEVKSGYERIDEELRIGKHSRLSGIILCAKHIENSGFIKHVPSVIINANAKVDNHEIIEKMANALFRFPEWH